MPRGAEVSVTGARMKTPELKARSMLGCRPVPEYEMANVFWMVIIYSSCSAC